jgi:AcrR family transcriptional regulator
LDPARKDAILGAALEAFATQGYEAASYNQIIEAAGISKGAMYYYFDDKEDLFSTVVRREVEIIFGTFEELPEVRDAPAFWAMVRGFLGRLVSVAASRPRAMGLMRQVMRLKQGELHSPVIQEIKAIETRWTARLLDIGKALGAVRSDLPDELLLGLIRALDDAGDLYMASQGDSLREEEILGWGETFIDLARRIVEPKVTFG